MTSILLFLYIEIQKPLFIPSNINKKFLIFFVFLNCAINCNSFTNQIQIKTQMASKMLINFKLYYCQKITTNIEIRSNSKGELLEVWQTLLQFFFQFSIVWCGPGKSKGHLLSFWVNTFQGGGWCFLHGGHRIWFHA